MAKDPTFGEVVQALANAFVEGGIPQGEATDLATRVMKMVEAESKKTGQPFGFVSPEAIRELAANDPVTASAFADPPEIATKSYAPLDAGLSLRVGDEITDVNPVPVYADPPPTGPIAVIDAMPPGGMFPAGTVMKVRGFAGREVHLSVE